MTIPQTTKAPSISLDKRIVPGKVISVGLEAIRLELSDESPVRGHGRMTIRDLPKNKTMVDFSVGQIINVFLLKPSTKNTDLWFVSGRLANKTHNPWFSNFFFSGIEVKGTAISYVEDYAVIVELDNGLDAFLHRKNIPGAPRTPIHEIIHIGDRIASLIIDADSETLRLDISITELLKIKEKKEFDNRAETQKDKRKRHPDSSAQEKTTQNHLDVVPHKTKVLLIDDDQFFVQAIRNWLSNLGIENYSYTTTQAILQCISSDHPTHILLDFDLKDRTLEEEITYILQNKTTTLNISYISSAWDLAYEKAKQKEYEFIPKPIDLSHLLEWLKTGIGVKKQLSTAEQRASPDILWGPSAQERKVLRQANRFLFELCNEVNCQAALWVKREREGVYSVRAFYGLKKNELKRLEPRYNQCLFTGVISSEQETSQNKSKSDPLWEIAPPQVGQIWGIPLKAHNKTERALVFFSKTPLSASDKEFIRNQRPRMRDLIDRLELILTVRELVTFSTAGKISSGLIHELRGAMSPIRMGLKRLRRKISRGDYLNNTDALLKDIYEIEERAEKAEKLSKNNLNKIQYNRREIIRVDSCIRQILSSFSTQASRHNTALEHIHPEQDLTVNLPPEVFEQPLINLIDNAIYHIGSRQWGRIQVEVQIKHTSPMPLHIIIRDNGLGMNADQQTNLFKPRKSSKGLQGVGMGTYLSRNITRAVGGDIKLIESFRWVGSSFVIMLPMTLKDMSGEQ
ncbi:S1 RNA-binding domain-containing protein [Marinifilum sp. JC120]|nr:S1 RNA-binding domain-containing protein [Marinifilum sp. JC120]